MKRRNDLTGMHFGKWTVNEFSHINESRSAYWKCTCNCGTTKIVAALNLRKGTSTQCRACAGKEKTSVYKQGNKKKYIYIFKMHSYYKIGVTDNPKKRLDDINRKTPYYAEQIYVGINKEGLEQRIHLMLSSRQVKGEWFVLSETELEDVKKTIACTSGSCEI